MAIVTFTTDFGVEDGYVAAMKGVVLGHDPGAQLIDVTHLVPPQDVHAGAFILAQAASCFPPGTIHVCVVDPGVGSKRAEIVADSNGQFFIGPDNGLISLAAPEPSRTHAISASEFRREPVSATFHGRDVFAQTAGRLASGWSIEAAGPPLPGLTPLFQGIRGGSGGEGRVLHIDHYGNVITSLGPDELSGTQMLLDVLPAHQGTSVSISRTFSDVAVGMLLAYQGSSGFVEIAVRNGSAARQLGVGRGDMLRLRNHS